MNRDSDDLFNSNQKDQDDPKQIHNDLAILEIDLVEKLKFIWDERRKVILITVVFFIFGIFHYTFTPGEYESSATLIQEIESSGSFDGGSAFLRSLTGMNFPVGGSSGNLSAAARGRAPLPVHLYPDIVNSSEFLIDLIYRELEFSTLDTTITLYDYFTNFHETPVRDRTYTFIGDVTIYLPFTIFNYLRRAVGNIRSSFSKKNDSLVTGQNSLAESAADVTDHRLLVISNRERSVIEQMRTRININIGSSTTIITTSLPDPKAAALTNVLLVERIQDFMTEYRIEKARQNLEDTIAQYEEARKRYDEANYELARFLDENLNLRSNIAQLQETNLRDQRNLRLSVYNSLAQEVEQARLLLQQQIPVFNILEKPNIPNSPSTGASDLILVFSVVLGVFGGIAWVLISSSSIFTKKDR